MKIGIIDYGMGNLHSVSKALALQNAEVSVTDSRESLRSSDLLVLPGVGAFGAAMATLRKKKLDDFVRRWILEGKAYLGICLGFQLLFESSEESPGVKGLGVLKGNVVSLRPRDFKSKSFNIPHMGWNTAGVKNKAARGLFSGLKKNDYFYFVHTYFPVPVDSSVICTETTYGRSFCSSIYRENIFASQFHPEKSGRVGLRLLKNIVKRANPS